MKKDKEIKDKARKEELKSLTRKSSPERRVHSQAKKRRDSFGRGK